MIMLRRDATLAERNALIQKRDDAIVALQLQGNSTNNNNMVPDSPENGTESDAKHIYGQQQMLRTMAEAIIVIATTTYDWAILHEMDSDKKGYTQLTSGKDDWGLNQINCDESVMPVPVCSCTGTPQLFYKSGHGGWQSACCTTTISMYPLPQISNKRYSWVGGRKMSGDGFSKLFNRLAAQGYDLSIPLDLKDHWAKRDTNRYNTLK
ncbi:hypothetical protein P3S68_006908 [Capsicum galapagoense]